MLDVAPVLGDASVEERWSVISDAINAIFNRTLSRYSFQQVHQSVFQMCQMQHSNTLFGLLHHALSKEVAIIRERLLVSCESVLQDLESEWENFTAALCRISDALFYLNRNYTTNHQTIAQMGENIFYMGILKDEVISDTFVGCVRRSLELEFASQKSLERLAIKLRELYRDTVFEPLVKQPLLEVLTAKHKDEMEQNLDSLDADNYIVWALGTINQARSDISQLVGDSMNEDVEQHMGGLLIKQNTQRLLCSCPGCGSNMVRTMNSASLERLTTALLAVDEGCALVNMLISTTKSMGCELLDEVENDGPVTAVGKVLNLRSSLELLVEKLPGQLKDDSRPITLALAEIVSERPDFATKLAYYYDAKVRSKMTLDSMRQVATDTFSLYKLLKSKDSFEQTFKLLLAARLINCRSDDPLRHESIFVEMLRNDCGDTVANHLDVMIKDGKKRSETNREFLAFLSPGVRLPLSFEVTVITAGVWPIYPDFEINLPECMERCVALFQAYYIPHHNGRVLTFHRGCGTIHFQLNHGDVYELAAPTSFVNTVLCFQGNGDKDDQLTLWDVCHRTKMTENDVFPQLEAMVDIGLINSSFVDGTSRFVFNDHFAYPKTKLRIGVVNGGRQIKSNAEVRVSQGSPEALSAESIQAALIQIIKRNKVLRHSEFCTHVFETLKKSGITPTMTHIKQNLEVLINKGMISRGNRSDIYIYES